MTPYYLWRCSGIILLGLLIYAQTCSYDFVFDDRIFIVANPFIKNFSHFAMIWQNFPLTRLIGMFSFALNYNFCQLNPAGYHLFNLAVHFLAVALVWALADLLFNLVKILPSKEPFNKELPFLIAILFLVHPCQTQAITYITQRFESMATVFYLAAIYTYLRARLTSRVGLKIVLFGCSGLATFLGILTKETAVTIPLMILVSEWILFPKKVNRQLYISLWVSAVLIGLFFYKMVHINLSVLMISHISESHDGDILTPLRYVLTQLRVFLTFFRIFILPIHQNLDYDYPASTSLITPPLTLVGLVVIAAFIYVIVKIRRKFPLIAWGLAWVLITFSINLVPRSNVIFEHKMYLISFGFFLALVSALSVWIPNRLTLIKILACLIVVLSIVTYCRNKVWANELLLWEDSIKLSPHKARVNASLGRIYGSMGRLDQSIEYLSRSIAISPDNITYENRGVIEAELGSYDKALEDLNKSISMDPTYYLPYIKRAHVYWQKHNINAAMSDLQLAIREEPYFTEGYLEKGMIEAQTGNNMQALHDFQQALKIDPLNADILMKVGAEFYSLGQYNNALESFTKAKSLDPSNSTALQYSRDCLVKLGQT